jgi:putative ABC transport system permease protein
VIFKVGASLSIFIACLGLFGLASFTVQKRIKELGIRKILGSSQWGIFLLLSSSFAKQILLSFIIAVPIAYYIMNNWLQNFEYRVGIGVGSFLLAGFFTFIVSMLTVSYRTVKAVNSNPIHSLRTE